MTYVLSDIHGDKDRLENILRQIDLKPEDHLYVIGDVIDRKPYGIETLNLLLGMKNVTLMLGNHELMMINTFSDWFDLSYHSPRFGNREAWEIWKQNGGRYTVSGLIGKTKSEIRDIIRTLNELPVLLEVEVNGKTFVLVHGSPLPEKHKDSYTPYDARSFMVWERITPDRELYQDKIVIFGHTPTIHYQEDVEQLSFWHGENRICIDCGCAYGDFTFGNRHYHGRLGCLRLDDMKEFYSD